MNEIGSLFVRLGLKSQGFKAGLDKSTQQTKKASQTMGSSLKSLQQNWMAVTAAVAGATVMAKKSIDAFMVQEEAEHKLATAMKIFGDYTRTAHKEMLEFASGLQKITTYGDEVTLTMMANLKTYGMNTDELKKATKATMDLASAKGIDLRAASDLVGKAFVGETGSLSRYGIIIEKGTEKTEKFAAVLNLINKQFGGSAQAEIDTYSGQLKQISNWWGDITEQVGFGLIKALEGLLGALGWVSSGFFQMLSAIQAGFAKVYEMASHLPGKAGKFFKDMGEIARESAAEYDNLAAKSMDFSMKNFKMMVSNAKESKKIINEVAKESEKIVKSRSDTTKYIDSQVLRDIKKLTLDELDFKKWALDQEYKEKLGQVKDKAALDKWYKLESEKIEKSRLDTTKDINQVIKRDTTDVYDTMSQGLTDFFHTATSETLSFEDFFKGTWGKIASSFQETIVKMTSRWTTNKISGFFGGGGTSTSGGGTSSSGGGTSSSLNSFASRGGVSGSGERVSDFLESIEFFSGAGAYTSEGEPPGALKGAISGAQAGAQIGTMILPVIGTSIGAAIGSIVGSIRGSRDKYKHRGTYGGLLANYSGLQAGSAGTFGSERGWGGVSGEPYPIELKEAHQSMTEYARQLQALPELTKAAVQPGLEEINELFGSTEYSVFFKRYRHATAARTNWVKETYTPALQEAYGQFVQMAQGMSEQEAMAELLNQGYDNLSGTIQNKLVASMVDQGLYADIINIGYQRLGESLRSYTELQKVSYIETLKQVTGYTKLQATQEAVSEILTTLSTKEGLSRKQISGLNQGLWDRIGIIKDQTQYLQEYTDITAHMSDSIVDTDTQMWSWYKRLIELNNLLNNSTGTVHDISKALAGSGLSEAAWITADAFLDMNRQIEKSDQLMMQGSIAAQEKELPAMSNSYSPNVTVNFQISAMDPDGIKNVVRNEIIPEIKEVMEDNVDEYNSWIARAIEGTYD